MAKKTEKKTAKVNIITSRDVHILKLTNEVKAQAENIFELNQRIDSIINAHEQCKRLKGL